MPSPHQTHCYLQRLDLGLRGQPASGLSRLTSWQMHKIIFLCILSHWPSLPPPSREQMAACLVEGGTWGSTWSPQPCLSPEQAGSSDQCCLSKLPFDCKHQVEWESPWNLEKPKGNNLGPGSWSHSSRKPRPPPLMGGEPWASLTHCGSHVLTSQSGTEA